MIECFLEYNLTIKFIIELMKEMKEMKIHQKESLILFMVVISFERQ